MFDYLICDGKVIDGAGNPWYAADIGIKDGRIAAIGRLSGAEAGRRISCKGAPLGCDQRNPFPHLTVAPGFIDCHSHGDRTLLAGAEADSMIRQGVTTQIVGHCGSSPAPLCDRNRDHALKGLRTQKDSPSEASWKSFGEYLEVLEQAPLTTNVVHFVGHNTIRMAVIGDIGRAATPEDIPPMRRYVEEAMEAGAVGLSSGVEFFPGRCSEPGELKELCEVVASSGGLYSPHIRNRDQYYEKAIEEVLWIARNTGVNLQFAHLNCRENTGANRNAWQRVMALVERAREMEGLDVATDCIPYAWGPGGYVTILPDWFLKDGIKKALSLLDDPQVRRRLRVESDRYWRFIHRGEWHRVILSFSVSHSEFNGKSFDRISQMWGKDPWDCYFDILKDEGEKAPGLHLYGRLFTEEHVQEMLTHPLFMVASDAYAQNAEGPLSDFSKNMGAFGWTARLLGYYVREQGLLTLHDAVRRMTGFPAQKFGVKDRGLIREGMAADLVVFDADVITETGTIDFPNRYPTGIEYVLVNGKLVIDQGDYKGETHGKVLRMR